MKDYIKMVILILVCVFSFCFGMCVNQLYHKTEIKQVQTALDVCENMWKLNAELFYPELCKTVCAEEFEKMGC